jgi:hypothetical protein
MIAGWFTVMNLIELVGLDSQVTQFSVPRSLNDVTRESKLQKPYLDPQATSPGVPRNAKRHSLRITSSGANPNPTPVFSSGRRPQAQNARSIWIALCCLFSIFSSKSYLSVLFACILFAQPVTATNVPRRIPPLTARG